MSLTTPEKHAGEGGAGCSSARDRSPTGLCALRPARSAPFRLCGRQQAAVLVCALFSHLIHQSPSSSYTCCPPVYSFYCGFFVKGQISFFVFSLYFERRWNEFTPPVRHSHREDPCLWGTALAALLREPGDWRCPRFALLSPERCVPNTEQPPAWWRCLARC